ncbi:MAG: MarR family transcriptional regulator [Alphaproteobacteria bacterium]|nr:MarR family transcriptional regulator [Alphaproteobacteria bacterium]
MSKQAFSAVMHLLRAYSALEERFSGALSVHGLSLKEVLLLMHLEREPSGRLTRVALAKRLNVSASTVTRMAQPLEKCCFVSRETDARDARLAFVVLTDAGKEAVTNTRATLQRLSSEVFRDRWTKEDISQLAELLGRLTAGHPGDIS